MPSTRVFQIKFHHFVSHFLHKICGTNSLAVVQNIQVLWFTIVWEFLENQRYTVSYKIPLNINFIWLSTLACYHSRSAGKLFLKTLSTHADHTWQQQLNDGILVQRP